MTKISNQYSLTNVLTADAVNGRVGIGTTSPTVPLDVVGAGKFSGVVTANIGSYAASFVAIGSSAGNGQIQLSSSSNYSIGAGTDFGGMGLYVGGVYRQYILNNGNVGIGTTSPAVRLDVTGTDDVDSSIFFRVYSNNRTVWTGLGYRRIETNSELYIVANDSTIFRNSGSERMRITSGGTLLVGTTTSYSGKIVGFGDVVAVAGGGSNGLMSHETGNNTRYGFYNNGAGSLTVTNSGVANVGNFNMSSGAYTASSDINKKKDIEESTLGLNEILSLIPKTYRFKTESDEDKKHIGFIAQEVASIVPYAYSETKQPDELFIGLEYTAFIPVLVKAIQEQQLQINELKALLNA